MNNIHGLFEVITGIYQVRGYDLASMTIIEADNGWIIVDPLTSRESLFSDDLELQGSIIDPLRFFFIVRQAQRDLQYRNTMIANQKTGSEPFIHVARRRSKPKQNDSCFQVKQTDERGRD